MPDLSSSAAVSPASVMALTLDHSGLYREQASFAALADFLRQSRFARPLMCGWTPGPLAAYCCCLLLLPGGTCFGSSTYGVEVASCLT